MITAAEVSQVVHLHNVLVFFLNAFKTSEVLTTSENTTDDEVVGFCNNPFLNAASIPPLPNRTLPTTSIHHSVHNQPFPLDHTVYGHPVALQTILF